MALLALQYALPRIDEASRDASLVDFREVLSHIIERRDIHGLVRMLDPSVKSSLAAPPGPQEFINHYDLENATSRGWLLLQRIADSGGVFLGPTEFCAPYYSAAFPAGLNPYTHGVVKGTGVPMYGAASGGRTVALLDDSIVAFAPGALEDSVARVLVKTRDGKTGYVARSAILSPLDYRLCFTKGQDGWRISAFVGED